MVSDANTGVNYFNTITGLLGKAIDVAPDIVALKESGVKIGSVYPSGQSDPGAVVNEKAQEKTEKVVEGTYLKYVLYGLGGLAVLGLVYYIAKKA